MEKSVDDYDLVEVAKGLEARIEGALPPANADCVQLSREEAGPALALISALIEIVEKERRGLL